MSCNASYARLFWERFLYAGYIDMQHICTSILTKKLFFLKAGVTNNFYLNYNIWCCTYVC
jgi:hypothetical protein